MAPKILYQRDRLTVTDSHLTVGRITAFYPNISALSIYDGRPLLPSAILAAIGLIPGVFLLFTMRKLIGPYLPMKLLAIFAIPLIGYLIFGLWYRVKCLFVTIDGQAVAVLKSKDLAVLEQAKASIEAAKFRTAGKTP